MSQNEKNVVDGRRVPTKERMKTIIVKGFYISVQLEVSEHQLVGIFKMGISRIISHKYLMDRVFRENVYAYVSERVRIELPGLRALRRMVWSARRPAFLSTCREALTFKFMLDFALVVKYARATSMPLSRAKSMYQRSMT